MRLIRLIRPIRLNQEAFIRLTKKSLITILGVWVILVSSGLIYMFKFAKSASAVWFDDNWGYRQRIPIDTHTASETNVYNAISVDSATLTTDKLQADCDDLRFTKENGEILPYQIVSGCDTATTVINVGFDTMPVAPFNIYMYYGNPTAVAGSTTLAHSACGNGCAEGTFASEEKAPSPVAYWKFDDGTGTNANDATTNNNDGTLGGTTVPTWQTEDMCVSGKCLKFDGSTSKVTTSTNPIHGITTFTISTWFKATTIGSVNNLIGNRSNPAGGPYGLTFGVNNGLGLGANDNSIIVATGYSAANRVWTTPTNSITTGTWYHAVLVWTQGSTPVVYLNGVSQTMTFASGFVLSNNIDWGSTNNAFGIGESSQAYSSSLFKGFIDEPKIYNYARSAAQIQADYNARANAEGASAVLGAQNQPAALSNGLVGYWKMDESSWTQDCTTATATDSSGNGNTGKSCPSTTGPTTGAGKFGNGGVFDASNDRVQVADNSSIDFTASQNFTFAAWVKNTTDYASGEFHGILGKGDNAASQGFYNFHVNSTEKPAIQIGGASNTTVTANTSLGSSGVWNHVVAVFNRTGTVTFYLNGQSDGSGDISGQNVDLSNDDVLYIGSERTAVSFFGGTLDDVRVYNRALSGNEISQLYNFAPGPVGYWRFDEGSGNANDSSGNANTGTVSGAAYSTGKYGKALNYDGTDDVTTVTNASAIDMNSYAGGITFEAWVYADSDGEGDVGQIYQKGTTTYLRTDTQSGSNLDVEASLDLATTDATLNISSGITTGTWNHIVVTYEDDSDDEITIYINGVNKGSSTNGVGAIAADTSDLLIGGTTTANFDGKIDDFKMYGYARTAGQIIEDMNAGHPAPGSPVGTPLGYWKFDEGADNTCSGGSNDACNSGSQGSTLDGAESGMAVPATSTSGWTQAGKFGKALLFDGTDDLVDMGNPTTLQITSSFTLSAWIKTSAASNRAIIYKANNTGNSASYYLNMVSGNLRVYINTGSCVTATDVYRTGTKTINDGNWHHVVGVFDSSLSTLKLYVDGLEDTGSLTGTVGSSTANCSVNLRVGSSSDGAQFFSGTVDEPKVYNFALTADQVKLDMNRGSSQVLGALSDSTTYPLQATNQEYCIPGDSTSCVAPVGRWDFEEGSGTTANDTSGNANTGTLTLGPTYTRGKVGKAINFDGSDDYINVTDATNLNFGTGSFSASAWFKTSSTSDIYILSKATATVSIEIALEKWTDNLFRALVTDAEGDGVNIASTGTTVNDNAWHFGEAVFNGSTKTLTLYLDGKQVNTGTNASIGTLSTSGRALNIGKRAGDSPYNANNWSGSIDQVRMFDYARSAAQVAWDYNKGAPVGHWKMDECQGTVANDSSGNSNTGTITIGATGTQTSAGTCSGSANTAWKDGVTGKRNYSLDFDGTDDYVSVSGSTGIPTGNTPYTIAAWIKPTSYGVYGIIGWGNWGTTNQVNAFRLTATGLVNYWWGNDLTVTVSGLTDGNWHHVVALFDGTTRRIYVDGRQVGSDTPTSHNATFADFNIGRTNTTEYFPGQIDDARIYNYALTAVQVKSLYSGGALNFSPVTGAP